MIHVNNKNNNNIIISRIFDDKKNLKIQLFVCKNKNYIRFFLISIIIHFYNFIFFSGTSGWTKFGKLWIF